MKLYQIYFDNILLEGLKIILKMPEFINITAAATNLNIRMATASAAIKRVESALGAELFNESECRCLFFGVQESSGNAESQGLTV